MKTIIWLHGLGADGSDFASMQYELNLSSSLNVHFIFPDAPVMPVTINHGYPMRAWFDIVSLSLNIDKQIDEAGIANAVASIEKLIAKEMARGLLSTDIVLAGFSQGAVVALNTGLCYSQPLAGVIALSGFLPLAEKVLARTNAANQHLPIFLAHGTEDDIVPFTLGKHTERALKQAGYTVDWHPYPMPHTVCTEEIRDISEWLKRVLN